MSDEIIEQVARFLWECDQEGTTDEWREMAWSDMGGSEPTDERQIYEIRARALADAGLLAQPMDKVALDRLQELANASGYDRGFHLGWDAALAPERTTTMIDYTPTTLVVKHAVTYERERLGEPRPIKPEAFDRWLDEVRAEAWQEGHSASESEWMHTFDGHPVPEGEMCPECSIGNPYRQGKDA